MDSKRKRPFNYGGQAVLEGVMMRGRRWATVAVRAPSSEVIVHSERLPRALYASWVIKMPFVRGVVMLWDALVLGMKALMFSAEVALREEGQGAGGESAEPAEFNRPMLWTTTAIAMVAAVGIFFVGPLLLMGFIDQYIESAFVSNLIEGVIRLAVFLAYLWGIGWMPDIRRVFAYHGAEHKSINAFEAGEALEASCAARYTTAHPRCGTSFLLVVMAISILVFALLGRPPMEWRILSRIVLIPVIAGIAYEFLKFTAANYANPVVRWLAAPGLALQRLTTREPDESMLEVAMVALREVIRLDGLEEETLEAHREAALGEVALDLSDGVSTVVKD